MLPLLDSVVHQNPSSHTISMPRLGPVPNALLATTTAELQSPQAPRALTKAWMVVKTELKGRCMQAIRDTDAGERIIAETPLLALAAIPSDVRDDSQWLVPARLANGRDTVKIAISQMPEAVRKKLRKLHCAAVLVDKPFSSPGEYLDHRDMRIVALNGFTHIEDINSIPHSTTRVSFLKST